MKRPLVRLFQVECHFKVKWLDKTLAGNIICRDRRSTQRNATPSTASSKARSELSTDKNDASVMVKPASRRQIGHFSLYPMT